MIISGYLIFITRLHFDFAGITNSKNRGRYNRLGTEDIDSDGEFPYEGRLWYC